MYTPCIPHDEMESVTPEWYEPFPEPQPFPSGWDLSEAVYASPIATSENTIASAED